MNGVFDMFRTFKCSSSERLVHAILWYFTARWLELLVRNPPRASTSVFCECRVLLSSNGLCDETDHSSKGVLPSVVSECDQGPTRVVAPWGKQKILRFSCRARSYCPISTIFGFINPKNFQYQMSPKSVQKERS